MDKGATSVSAYITHGVLSGGAVARVARPLSIASLMAEAMRRITDEASVSSLFD
jgi:ribose-phosphate pyrophosphokinase